MARCESCGSTANVLTGDSVDLCRPCAEELAREEAPVQGTGDEIHIAINALAEAAATDGGCSEEVSVEFLRGLPAEVAAIKNQRDEARAEVERLTKERDEAPVADPRRGRAAARGDRGCVVTLPDIGFMSLEHLLDEHAMLYLDGRSRAEILRRFAVQREQIAALQRIIAEDQTPAGIEVARYRADVERLRADRDDLRRIATAATKDRDDLRRIATAAVNAIKKQRDEARAEVERLTKERDEAVAKMGRYRNDVERLRAILQEDDQRAWVAMGRPENTRTTNAVRICEELTAARAEVARLRAALAGLLKHIDEMPNPHSDPMRHYYNQMQVWKGDVRDAMKEAADDQ